MPRISIKEFNRIAREESPFGAYLGLELEKLERGRANVRLPYRDDFLRPGGAVAGPVLMAIADFAMYAAVMSVADDGKMAVTTSMTTNFLRRTAGSDLIAEARVLRAGRRLVVSEVSVHAAGDDAPVAHVTGTYVRPGSTS